MDTTAALAKLDDERAEIALQLAELDGDEHTSELILERLHIPVEPPKNLPPELARPRAAR